MNQEFDSVEISFFFCYIQPKMKKRLSLKIRALLSLEEASGMDDPWTYADFRGTPTYFAVFKMMFSSKNVNQNMLKNSLFFRKNL